MTLEREGGLMNFGILLLFFLFFFLTFNEAKICRTYAKIGLCIINKRDPINCTFTLTIADLPRLHHRTPMGKSL